MKHILITLAILSANVAHAYTLKDIKSVCEDMESIRYENIDEFFLMALEMHGIEVPEGLYLHEISSPVKKANSGVTLRGTQYMPTCIKGLKNALEQPIPKRMSTEELHEDYLRMFGKPHPDAQKKSIAFSSLGAAEPAAPRVLLKTDLGEIVIELNSEKAPVTVANFIQYVNDHHYDGVIFHRVMKDFMIQSGAFTFDMTMKKGRAPIINESNNGLKNLKGTVAMARTSAPNSATSQFFINHKTNAFLDYKDKSPGYAVFGKVVEGMDTVDKIAQAETARVGYHANAPKDTIRILTARLLDSKTQAPVAESVKEPESVKAPETVPVK